MEKILTLKDLFNFKLRFFIYLSSVSTLLFGVNYCTNVCPYINSVPPSELTFNLFIVFIFHIIVREILYFKFNEPSKKLTLPRHAYYLSIISWLIAGVLAFLIHFIKYPDFPIGSHFKLLSSYWVLGAAILSQLEYMLFEFEYKKIAKDIKISFYSENISRRIIESFIILTVAPALTIILVLARYYEDLPDNHVVVEVGYIVVLFIVSSIISSVLFSKMLKKDTKVIIDNLSLIENGNFDINMNLSRSDELGKISNAINKMAYEIGNLNKEITDTQSEIVNTMGEIAETRSKETGNHVKRVAEYSKLLALKYGLSNKEAELLKHASPMHDIGKVGIPDNILNKPGKHTQEESIIMKTHAQLGFDILKNSNRPILKAAAIVSREHHEKWDGSGYPRGLSGEDIHIYGRITAIADVFDALGSDRCYKKAWDDERIFNLFKEEKGKHFDPKLVDIFFDNLNEFMIIRDKFKDIV